MSTGYSVYSGATVQWSYRWSWCDETNGAICLLSGVNNSSNFTAPKDERYLISLRSLRVRDIHAQYFYADLELGWKGRVGEIGLADPQTLPVPASMNPSRPEQDELDSSLPYQKSAFYCNNIDTVHTTSSSWFMNKDVSVIEDIKIGISSRKCAVVKCQTTQLKSSTPIQEDSGFKHFQ